MINFLIYKEYILDIDMPCKIIRYSDGVVIHDCHFHNIFSKDWRKILKIPEDWKKDEHKY